MRSIPAAMELLWNQGGPFIGEDGAPHGRVTVEPDWALTLESDVLTANPANLPYRWWQRIDNGQTEVEVPNIKGIQIDRSLDADAQTCTITLYNQTMARNTVAGIPGQLGAPGYLTWNYGERDAETRWGQEANDWNNVLIPNALLRTYQGYGGRSKSIEEALEDGNLLLSGVWLIDEVRVGTDGMITLSCRDMAKLLIEQQLFTPLVPGTRYPVHYFRWTYSPLTYPGAPVYGFLNPIEQGPGSEGPKFVRDIAMAADGTGYWILGTDGGVFSFGVPFYGSRGDATQLDAPMAAMAADPLNQGYWLAAEDGGVFTFGEVGFYGSATASSPDTVSGMAAHPDGRGYWLVATDGSVYAFGSAQYYGGNPVGATLIAGIEATPTGNGYWLISTEGHVYTFGDAGYHGGIGGLPVDNMASALNTTPSGLGYYIATVQGEVYAFGDAVLRTPNGEFAVGALSDWVLEMTVTPTGNGYILVGGDGSVFTFGDAPFWGSLLSDFTYTQKLNGNYFDYVDIIKDLVRWAGWLAYGDGFDDVFGVLESTGAYSEDEIDASLFDKRPVIDAINGIKEIVGYHVWIDEEGGFHFESPNWYRYGNILDTTSQRQEFVYSIDERYQLTDYLVSYGDNSVRSEIIIASHDPTASLAATVTTRTTIESDLLRGMVRPAMWVNGFLSKKSEQERMLERIIDHINFSLRQGTVTCVANPAIQINDQVRIYERQTGETFVHYVKGIQSNMDLDSGEWTTTLTTFWLGEDWVIPDQPATPLPGETQAIPGTVVEVSSSPASTSSPSVFGPEDPLVAVPDEATLFGEVRMKAAFGWMVPTNTSQVATFEAIETELDRDISYCSATMGFRQLGAGFLGEAKSNAQSIGSQWAARTDVTLCLSVPLISSSSGDEQNSSTSWRQTSLQETIDGDHDGEWDYIIGQFVDNGLAATTRFRLASEMDVYPGNPYSKWSIGYTTASENLWRDAFDHVAQMCHDAGISVDYCGNGPWHSQARNTAPGFASTDLRTPYEFAEPTIYDMFGQDIYGVGGGRGKSISQVLSELDLNVTASQQRGVRFVIPEVGVWAKTFSGVRTATTDAQAQAFMKAWMDRLSSYPADSFLYWNYSPEGEPDGGTSLTRYFPGTWEYVKARLL